MSDQGNKRNDPEAIKATAAERPGATGQRPPRAPTAPRRNPPLETGPGREGGNIPDQLTRSQEAMEIQNQAADFKARARRKSAEERNKPTGPAAALTGASSLLKLSKVSWTCSLVCLCAALVVFFWPLFMGVVKGLPAPEAKSKAGGKLVVYTPGDTTMAQGQKPGGKWSAGAGGSAQGGASAGGGTKRPSGQNQGLTGLIPKLPSVGPLGPERELSFMIFSKPDKAEVILDGQPRGQTPVGANLDCRENEQVPLEMRKNGYKVWEKVFRCKEGRIKVEGILKRE